MKAEKNPAAAELARLKWSRMTVEQRSEHARMMNLARWHGRKKPLKKSGPLPK